jgi:hypothetical protein
MRGNLPRTAPGEGRRYGGERATFLRYRRGDLGGLDDSIGN